jgi:hypothetical protein
MQGEFVRPLRCRFMKSELNAAHRNRLVEHKPDLLIDRLGGAPECRFDRKPRIFGSPFHGRDLGQFQPFTMRFDGYVGAGGIEYFLPHALDSLSSFLDYATTARRSGLRLRKGGCGCSLDVFAQIVPSPSEFRLAETLIELRQAEDASISRPVESFHRHAPGQRVCCVGLRNTPMRHLIRRLDFSVIPRSSSAARTPPLAPRTHS